MEILWDPQKESINVSDILEYFKKTLRMEVESFTLSRGSFLTEIPQSKVPAQVKRKVSLHLVSRATVSVRRMSGFQQDVQTPSFA